MRSPFRRSGPAGPGCGTTSTAATCSTSASRLRSVGGAAREAAGRSAAGARALDRDGGQRGEARPARGDVPRGRPQHAVHVSTASTTLKRQELFCPAPNANRARSLRRVLESHSHDVQAAATFLLHAPPPPPSTSLSRPVAEQQPAQPQQPPRQPAQNLVRQACRCSVSHRRPAHARAGFCLRRARSRRTRSTEYRPRSPRAGWRSRAAARWATRSALWGTR